MSRIHYIAVFNTGEHVAFEADDVKHADSRVHYTDEWNRNNGNSKRISYYYEASSPQNWEAMDIVPE